MGYFRSATAYLSVIRHLSARFRIVLLNTNTDRRLKEKTGGAEAVFVELCRQWGAYIAEPGERISCSLLVVQQFVYEDALAQVLSGTITAREKVGMLTLATAGIEKHDRFIMQFGLRKAYVPSRRFSEFLLRERNAVSRYEGIDLVEVGLPFRHHPVFPEFSAEYIILAPTLFSFNSEEEKHGFLRSVLCLMDQIPRGEKVVYKPHNGSANDYLSPRAYRAAARVLRKLISEELLARIARKLPRCLATHADRVRTSMLFEEMQERAVRLDALTPYAEISVEAFLPGVTKGVIGGLSNTIWGAMYFDLPFYNCVNLDRRAPDSSLLPKTAGPLLELNLQYFGVPFCGGNLRRGVKRRDIFSGTNDLYDCVRAIEDDLETRRVATA